MSIRGLTAVNNTAKYGGVISAHGHMMTLSGLLAYNNSAEYGGVVYCNACEMLAT